MTLYDSIGKKYNQSRQADLRIIDRLIDLLDLPTGSLIADLGAGTGNYSNALAERGYRVIAISRRECYAIEPSLVMQNQAIPHQNVSWLTACAEEIPLPDNSVNGAIAILSLHHFRDRLLAIKEIHRIIGDGNLVIFTFKSDRIPSFWLSDYFPYFLEEMKDVSIDIESIANEVELITHKKVEIIPFPVPRDLKDLFAAAGWAKPEIYLNSEVRNGISSFSRMPENELKQGLIKLENELKNGEWKRKYGDIQTLDEYDADDRFLFFKNRSPVQFK